MAPFAPTPLHDSLGSDSIGRTSSLPENPPTTSAPGLGSPLPHLPRDWAPQVRYVRAYTLDRAAWIDVRVQNLVLWPGSCDSQRHPQKLAQSLAPRKGTPLPSALPTLPPLFMPAAAELTATPVLAPVRPLHSPTSAPVTATPTQALAVLAPADVAVPVRDRPLPTEIPSDTAAPMSPLPAGLGQPGTGSEPAQPPSPAVTAVPVPMALAGPVTLPKGCADLSGSCAAWAKSAQQCAANALYMRAWCAATCGLCGADLIPGSPIWPGMTAASPIGAAASAATRPAFGLVAVLCAVAGTALRAGASASHRIFGPRVAFC